MSFFSKENFKENAGLAKNGPTALETYFQRFRNNIVGVDQTFQSPYGKKKIIYTDSIFL